MKLFQCYLKPLCKELLMKLTIIDFICPLMDVAAQNTKSSFQRCVITYLVFYTKKNAF